MYNVRDLQGIQTKLLSLSLVFYIIESKETNFCFLKNTSIARKCNNDDLAFMEELWAQLRKSSLLDSQRRHPSWSTVLPGNFSSLTWWPPQMRDGRGVAKHHALLSGGPALWRQSPQEQAHHVTTTWPPHVITRFFGFCLMQHYDTGKHYYHVF